LTQAVFASLGIPEESTTLIGTTDEEVKGAADTIVAAVEALPPDGRLLLIVDENLDLAFPSSETVSGSYAARTALNRMPPSEEARAIPPEYRIQRGFRCFGGVVGAHARARPLGERLRVRRRPLQRAHAWLPQQGAHSASPGVTSESPRSHLGVTSESSRRPSMPLAKLDDSLRKKPRGHLGVPSADLGLVAPSASPASIAA